MSISSITAIIVSLIVGFVLGSAYFSCLWISVRSLTTKSARWHAFAIAGILRFAAILGILATLLSFGVDAVLILAGGLGFLAARLAATRLVRSFDPPGSKEP